MKTQLHLPKLSELEEIHFHLSLQIKEYEDMLDQLCEEYDIFCSEEDLGTLSVLTRLLNEMYSDLEQLAMFRQMIYN